jgi:hypothetical protein
MARISDSWPSFRTPFRFLLLAPSAYLRVQNSSYVYIFSFSNNLASVVIVRLVEGIVCIQDELSTGKLPSSPSTVLSPAHHWDYNLSGMIY